MEFTLLWAALTAVALGWVGLRIWPQRLPPSPFDRLTGAAFVGLAAGRLTALITQGVNPVTNPGDILIVRGGVHSGAATIAFVLTLVWSTRKTAGAIDSFAPAVLLALAGWHAGCLWRNACLGTASDLPWTWAQEGSVVTRHPTEIYAAMGLALGAWLLSQLTWHEWLRAGAGLALAAGIRLVTEPLRPSLTGGPIGWYLAGLVIGLALMAWGVLDHAHART